MSDFRFDPRGFANLMDPRVTSPGIALATLDEHSVGWIGKY